VPKRTGLSTPARATANAEHASSHSSNTKHKEVGNKLDLNKQSRETLSWFENVPDLSNEMHLLA
jgi:hypothetical protein